MPSSLSTVCLPSSRIRVLKQTLDNNLPFTGGSLNDIKSTFTVEYRPRGEGENRGLNFR